MYQDMDQYATYVSYHEKFYGRREKLCFAPRARNALFARLQDGTWVISEHEKCYGALTIHSVSRRPIGTGILPVVARHRPPFPPGRPLPPCGRWVRPFAKVS